MNPYLILPTYFTVAGQEDLVFQGRGKYLQCVAQGLKTGLPARVSGRHVVRGTTVLNLSLPNKPAFNGGSKEGARVTGKAGENGQKNQRLGGGLTLDKTVGSHTSKALVSFGSI